MIVTSANTIALNALEVAAARANDVPLETFLTKKWGDYLEIRFINRQERDYWANLILAALPADPAPKGKPR